MPSANAWFPSSGDKDFRSGERLASHGIDL
jgi:hypothetical protein